MMGDEATKWFLRHHFRNHGLTVLRYFLKRGFMETLVKAYNICVTMVAQGHRHQLSIPLMTTDRCCGFQALCDTDKCSWCILLI